MATPISVLAFTRIVLYSQFFVRIPYPTTSFAGQTVVVTGSNTGLGLEAARHVVRLGASKVILAVRTIAKGEAAAADILATTRATKASIEVWQLDLSNHDSIKGFADRVGNLERLDAVIQNAGVLTNHWKMEEGEEAHIAINVIGAVLLGLLLLPKLRESAKRFGTRGRLSFVGSDMMYIAQFKEADTSGSLFDALRDKERADIGDRYATSKVLLFYAIREIAARSPLNSDSNVIINVMTPGLCKSTLFRDDMSAAFRFIQGMLLSIFARSTEVGGRTLVNAASPDLGPETHGAFLMDCKVGWNSPNVESAKGQELAKRSNAELFAKLEEIYPGITGVLSKAS